VHADRGANGPKNALQGVALIDCGTQRVPRIDLVDLERGRIEPRVLERTYVEGVRLAAMQATVGVDFDQYRGDLQQCIGAAVKTAGLHIDHDRQESAKPPGHQRRSAGGGGGGRFWRWLAHAEGRSRQPTVSPARSGTSCASPKG
jgi:hypothetical protein